MPGISTSKTSIPFSRGGSQSWEPEDANLAVSWIDDFARLIWDSLAGYTFEIWESINDGAYALVDTTADGASSYDNYTSQNASMKFKIRGLKGVTYTEYTSEVILSTPLVFKTDQTTLTQVIINSMIIAAGKTVNVNWGDGNNEDLTGTITNKTHDYGVGNEGIYYIQLSGDLNSITRFYHYNQAKSFGDLTKWILPVPNTTFTFRIYSNNFTGDISNWIIDKNAASFHIYNNNFTGKLPNLNGTIAGGLDYSAYGNNLSGSNLTNFKPRMTILNIKDQGEWFSTDDINELLQAIADFYEVNTPTATTCTFTMTGANMGVPVDGQSNADIVRTKGYYTAAGKTATFTINEPVPFDNAKLVLTFDGNYDSLFTVLYPILVAKGVNGTFYTWSDNIGQVGAYTWANCLTMIVGGSEIQCHSKDHGYLTRLSEAELRANLEAQNTAFVANGLPSPVHIAYPWGSSDDFVRSIVAEYRQTGRNFNFDVNNNVQYKNLNPYNFGCNWIDDHDDLVFDVDAFEDILDKAVAVNGLVVTCSHKGHTGSEYTYGSTNATKFAAIIDMAIAKGLDIITISELKTALDA